MSFRGVPSLPLSPPPRPAAPGLRSQQRPRGPWWPGWSRPLQSGLSKSGPQTGRWKRSPRWGSRFSVAGWSRGDCRVGVDRERPGGAVRLRAHQPGGPRSPRPETKPRRADRSRGFPRQPRQGQRLPAPGCGCALPCSRAGSFAFLGTACSVSVPPCPPENQFWGCGSGPQHVPGAQGAWGQGERQGPRPRPWQGLPTPQGSANAGPPPLAGHSPAEPRGEGTLMSPCSSARPAGTTLSSRITRMHEPSPPPRPF